MAGMFSDRWKAQRSLTVQVPTANAHTLFLLCQPLECPRTNRSAKRVSYATPVIVSITLEMCYTVTEYGPSISFKEW